jgi:hypothetical protein
VLASGVELNIDPIERLEPLPPHRFIRFTWRPPMSFQLRLGVLLIVVLTLSSSAEAARIDVPLTTLLAGSDRIALLVWDYEEASGDPNKSYSEVRFDGSQYTYIYGISRPLFLDTWRQCPMCAFFNGPVQSDYFDLQRDLPVETTWGFTDVDLDLAGGGSTNTDATSSVDCATSTGEPGPAGCDSGLIKVDFNPFTLDGTRLRGDPAGGEDFFAFYLLSENPPKLVPSLAIFSSQTLDQEGFPLQDWALLRGSVDVFAPVPEPGTLMLVGVAGVGLLAKIRMRETRNRRNGGRQS